jgi:hypothetical protein
MLIISATSPSHSVRGKRPVQVLVRVLVRAISFEEEDLAVLGQDLLTFQGTKKALVWTERWIKYFVITLQKLIQGKYRLLSVLSLRSVAFRAAVFPSHSYPRIDSSLCHRSFSLFLS